MKWTWKIAISHNCCHDIHRLYIGL